MRSADPPGPPPPAAPGAGRVSPRAGAAAADPAAVPSRWRSLPRRVWRVVYGSIERFIWSDGLTYAGAIAFDLLFALVPFVIFLVTLAGWMGSGEAATKSIDYALSLLPPEVERPLAAIVAEIQNVPHGGLLTLSILGTLWVASTAIESLRVALNRAHGATRWMTFWARRTQSLVIVILAALALMALAVVTVVVPLLGEIADRLAEAPVLVEGGQSQLAPILFGAVILFSLFSGLYIILPSVELRLRDVWPGALLGTLVWLVTGRLFSFYLRELSRMSVTYGSLGGVVIVLFFFYLSAAIFVFGAHLNAAILRERRGLPNPPGDV